MKLGNLTKKIVAVVLTFVMTSMLTVSAFAATTETGIQPLGSGNGWVSSTIVKNNVTYTLNAGIGLSSSTNGGYTGLQTTCNCTRTHGIVTMVYLAEGDGNITVKSSSSRTHKNVTGSTKSYEATPSSAYGSYIVNNMIEF